MVLFCYCIHSQFECLLCLSSICSCSYAKIVYWLSHPIADFQIQAWIEGVAVAVHLSTMLLTTQASSTIWPENPGWLVLSRASSGHSITLGLPHHSNYLKAQSWNDRHFVLEFAIFSTKISVALVSWSITMAIVFFSTIELMATQSASSSAVIVGARLPGVIVAALVRRERGILYWQRTYFCATCG